MKKTGVLLLYLLLFLLLFAQFPWQGRIPGNIDTWYAIAFTNAYVNELAEGLGLGSFGSFLYPVEDPFAFGETSVALALLPMALRIAGFSDTVAYYLFLSVIYAVTAWGAFMVAGLYVRHRESAVVAGLIFAGSNFMLSTIDSPHTTFFGLAFLSWYWFRRYITGGRTNHLWASAALAGLQTYLSAYVFLLLAIAISVLALANLKVLVPDARRTKILLASAALAGIIAAPFYVSYFVKLTGYFSWRSQALLFAEFNSLDLQDLFNPMPGNLIYPEGHRFDHDDTVRLQGVLGREDPSLKTDEFFLMIGASPGEDEESLWVSSRKRAFVGLIPLLLAGAGLLRREPGRLELALLGGAAMVLALGPVNQFGSRTLPMPAWLLYEHLPGFHMFRIPGRAFALTLLVLAIFAARGLGALMDRWKITSPGRVAAVTALVAAALAVENVPFPMRSFESEALARPPRRYMQFFADKPDAVILNLPSGIGYGLAGSADDLNVFNRELIYMNWQTYHGLSIANGVNGYIPDARIRIQGLIEALPSEEAVGGLRETGIDYVAFNKNLLLPGEAVLLRRLARAPGLKPVADSETTTILQVLP